MNWAWLQSTYPIRLNHRHKLAGHVLSGRYKAQLVESSGNGYLRATCDYVHLNPDRAGLLRAGERLLAEELARLGWTEEELEAPQERSGKAVPKKRKGRKTTNYGIHGKRKNHRGVGTKDSRWLEMVLWRTVVLRGAPVLSGGISTYLGSNPIVNMR